MITREEMDVAMTKAACDVPNENLVITWIIDIHIDDLVAARTFEQHSGSGLHRDSPLVSPNLIPQKLRELAPCASTSASVRETLVAVGTGNCDALRTRLKLSNELSDKF